MKKLSEDDPSVCTFNSSMVSSGQGTSPGLTSNDSNSNSSTTIEGCVADCKKTLGKDRSLCNLLEDPLQSESNMYYTITCSKRRFRMKKPFDGNTEALGWALDSVARSVSFIASAVFLGTALITLSKEAAGCETAIPPGEDRIPECHNRIYGIKPSSLLSTYVTTLGILSACTLPIIGAVIDHTPYRRELGSISAFLQCCIIFLHIFIDDSIWVLVAVFLIFFYFAGSLHSLSIFAYLPELSDEPDRLVRYTASFTMIQYASSAAFLISMVALLMLLGYDHDDVLSARVASAYSFIICCIFFGYSWIYLLRPRENFRPMPEGSTLCTVGFRKVFSSCRMIYERYKEIQWFFISVSLGEAAQLGFSVIGLTYMSDSLNMNSTEISIAILISFLVSIVGCFIGKLSIKKMSSIRSLQLCQSINIVNIIVGVAIINKPGQWLWAYGWCAIWGISSGWKATIERFVVCRIIPAEHEANTELMGELRHLRMYLVPFLIIA